MTLGERRQKLVEAALQVIGRSGVPAATTRAIAAEAGMPLASFHYAFESHEALMLEAMDTLHRLELERCAALELGGQDVAAMVAGVLDWCLDDVVQRRDAHMSSLELVDHALRAEGQQHRPAAWREARLDVLAAKVERFLADRPELGEHDARLLADTILAMADGLVLRYLSTGDEAMTRRLVAPTARLVSAT